MYDFQNRLLANKNVSDPTKVIYIKFINSQIPLLVAIKPHFSYTDTRIYVNYYSEKISLNMFDN